MDVADLDQPPDIHKLLKQNKRREGDEEQAVKVLE